MGTDTALAAALQAVVAAADADLATTLAPAVETATREAQMQARFALALLGFQGQGTPLRAVTVGEGAYGAESIFLIAQRELGDMNRWVDIADLSGLGFIALTAVQTLLLPLS